MMHRSRYYRNPAMYQARSEITPRFGYSPGSSTRNAYRRTFTSPFSPSHTRDLNSAPYPSSKLGYQHPRFVDRSKYVWTANKQQPSTQPVAQQPTQPTPPTPPTPVQPKVIRNPNCRELSTLSVTALDPAPIVAKDIAAKLKEEKVYLIRKVVDVVGVKKSIKLYYDTRRKESDGGILIQNGKRRRTSGGVFLTLLRETNYISKQEAETALLEIKRHESQMKIAHYHEGY